MPDYIVVGKKGAGKTLAMVGRMRDYVERGRPIATNVDLHLRKLTNKKPTAPIYRISDLPTIADLEAIGSVHETGREELNGALFFDECSAFLNSRNWNDKGRDSIIVWLAHARKRGWDCYFMVQSLGMLDKQVRESFGEHLVVCRRLDRLRIPFLGKLGKLVTLGLWSGKFPQIHVGVVKYGCAQHDPIVETWTYRAHDLYGAYETTQKLGHNDCQIHQLVWPMSERERAKLLARPKPKPKGELVQWVQRLPVDRRIPAMRRIGLA